MTPEEKATELVNKFYNLRKRPLLSFWKDIAHAKECAIIAVDEILQLPVCWFSQSASLEDDSSDTSEYWDEVKIEIEKVIFDALG